MANLAILGHPTRGREVVELLEMLGGKASTKLSGNASSIGYYINSNGNIDCKHYSRFDDTIQFTLEQFLEKSPYKVGDKVLYKTYGLYLKIKSMLWNEEKEQVIYRLDSRKLFVATADELQPCKEQETMEELIRAEDITLEKSVMCTFSEVVEGKQRLRIAMNEGFELKEENGNFFVYRKKVGYPKTYEECASILCDRASFRNNIGYKGNLLVNLQQLLVCRDAYWKIAGEQMGLGKLWEPDWLDAEQDKFVLYTHDNVICLNRFVLGHNVLAFPTAEMRDAFLENFKELIENCKELL